MPAKSIFRPFSLLALIAAIALAWALGAPTSVRADGDDLAAAGAGQPVFVGHHYEGKVTAVDSAGGSVTILTKYGEKSLTIRTAPDTEIWETVPSRPADVNVGDKVVVVGRDGADKDSMQVGVVDVVPDFPAKVLRNPPKNHRFLLYGTVTTLTPTITVTDLNNDVVTLQVSNGRFAATQTQPGQISDINIGDQVHADGDIQDGALAARSVLITPSDMRRFRGKLARRANTAINAIPAVTGAAGQNPAPVTSSPAPAPVPAAAPAPPANPTGPAPTQAAGQNP